MTESTSAAEHLRGMTDEMTALVREEVRLARDEVIANLRAAGRDLALVGAAGGAGLAGLLAGTIAAIEALHGETPRRGLPLWLSAGTVAALAGGAAFTLMRVAIGDLRERGVLPRRAMQDLEQTAGAVADELRDGASTAPAHPQEERKWPT